MSSLKTNRQNKSHPTFRTPLFSTRIDWTLVRATASLISLAKNGTRWNASLPRSRWGSERGAVIVAQELVGGGVVAELLRFGVPFQVRPGLHGDVGDERGAGAAVGALEVGVARGAGLEAVEEVAGVIGGVGAAGDLLRLDHRGFALAPAGFRAAIGGGAARELVGGDVFGHDFPAVAPHVERALGAAKLDLARSGRGGGAVGVELGVGDERVARVMPEG